MIGTGSGSNSATGEADLAELGDRSSIGVGESDGCISTGITGDGVGGSLDS